MLMLQFLSLFKYLSVFVCSIFGVGLFLFHIMFYYFSVLGVFSKNFTVKFECLANLSFWLLLCITTVFTGI